MVESSWHFSAEVPPLLYPEVPAALVVLQILLPCRPKIWIVQMMMMMVTTVLSAPTCPDSQVMTPVEVDTIVVPILVLIPLVAVVVVAAPQFFFDVSV